MSYERIATPRELPPAILEPIEFVLDSYDRHAREELAQFNLPKAELTRGRILWSSYAGCGLSPKFARFFEKTGCQVRTVINEEAFQKEHPLIIRGEIFGKSIAHKQHILNEVVAPGRDEPYYVDIFWQQFLQDMGQSETDLVNNAPWSVLPTEQVLCYQAEDLDVVADWFSLLVRNMQDKAMGCRMMETKTGSTVQSDMFTRQVGVGAFTGIFTNAGNSDPAVPYYSLDESAAIARQIWDPANFQELDLLEFAQ